MNSMLLYGVFMSFLIFLMGLFVRKFPSKYGSNTGINTTHARKSNDHWNYAQRYGPKYFIFYGLIALVINGIITIWASYLPKIQLVSSIVTITISLFSIILAFVKIEIMLKEFDKN